MESEQLEHVQAEAHIKGAIEAVQELLRLTIGRRDEYNLKADVTEDILEDMYDGPLQNQGSYLLASQAIKYRAQANAAQEASDEMEELLQALAEAEAKPLVVATGLEGGEA